MNEILLALELTAWGLGGIFFALLLFYLSIVVITKVFPSKD